MTEIDDSKTLKPIKTERRDKFTNLSDIEIKPLYTPEDIKNINYDKDLGSPGKFPFTRGAYPNMYRGRLWTMRQGCTNEFKIQIFIRTRHNGLERCI